ncbi:MAG: alpha-1,2-fucosyltransferase [Selenomonadaceae bacterium]|nr:alpha-1,2-fucosyltransferase [Selenomonadaceae bacterium]
MIISLLRGGLGNQFFQYALGRCLAHKNNTTLKLDLSVIINSDNPNESYRLGDFNIQENLTTPEELELVKNETDAGFDPEKNIRRIDTSDAPRAYVPELLAGANIDNVHLHGYWQREEYFKDIADILRKELTPKNPIGKVSESWRQKILASDCAVSLHVRRGDYLNPAQLNFGTLPVNYYFRCIKELKKSIPKFTVFVFSNDLEWAKENLDFGLPTEFVKDCEQDYEELYLMTLCKHNIIANSSFSWWGAWLNSNPDKKVFSPNDYLVTAEGFTSIAVDRSNLSLLDFPPLMSMVIYVDDENAVTAAQTMQINLSQHHRSFEVIILDASICNSGEAYRRFASLSRMTILKVNPAAGKRAAWNKGLDLAHGEYVIFLTGKDFIFSDTVGLIASLWESAFQQHFVRKLHGTNYEQFQSIAPQIICTYKNVAEKADGEVYITGIDDKKFTIKSAGIFQGWNTPTMIQIDDNSKLALLSNKQLDNLIGTKIFKRAFLVENKIYFDENMKGNAELMFLVNAFVRTEKIVIVPQVFYGRMN